MMSFSSLDSFIAHLRTLPAAVEAGRRRGLEAAGEGLVAGAQAMIGEEVREWPGLADITIQQKEALGYTGRISATDPLYRTGELRTSISYTLHGYGVTLGSTDPIAPYQENGTSRIPPRPFISTTMFRDGKAAADLVFGFEMAAFSSLPPPHHRAGDHLTGR